MAFPKHCRPRMWSRFCHRSASPVRRPGCGLFTCCRRGSNFESRWPGPSPRPGTARRSESKHEPAAEENGQSLACAAGSSEIIVFDEYTSVVDRTVAQVASHALQKTIRRKKLRFVAVTCHEDVEAWLNPDWVYRPAEELFTWRFLQRRPIIEMDVVRCHASAWRLFAPHHYLSTALARSAVCFLASWHDRPVAFSAWLPFVGSGPPRRREHRTVTLPDFQGVGIGNAVSDTIAAMWRALGYRAISTTTHPAMIRSRCRSSSWRMSRGPALATGKEKKLLNLRHATTRLTAGFEYIGPALPRLLALSLLDH